MEIFNVNRQAYQHLGRMTYANLPSPSTVPEGTRATLFGWTAPEADWLTSGGYWLPVGGRAVVHAPMLVNAQAQNGGAAPLPVASVPGWTMPLSMAQTPNLSLETHGYVEVTAAPSAEQARQLFVGIYGVDHALVAAIQYSSTAVGHLIYGQANRRSDGNWARLAGINFTHVSNAGVLAKSDAEVTSGPITLNYRGGAANGSEVITVHNFSLIVRVG